MSYNEEPKTVEISAVAESYRDPPEAQEEEEESRVNEEGGREEQGEEVKQKDAKEE